MANEESINNEVVDNQEESSNENSSTTMDNENHTEIASSDEQKKSKLKKILIILVAVLLVVVLIILTLFFTGVFDKEEEIKTPVQNLKKELEVKEENYKFDLKSIDSKKLNEQLTQLTNQSLSEEKSSEYQKIKAERKKLEEEKKELELIKKEKEELLKQKEILEQKKNELEKSKTNVEELKQITKEEVTPSENNKAEKQTENNDTKNSNNESSLTVKKEIKKTENFLLFINVATIEGSLLKNFLDDLTKINADILLCRDDINRIEVYYGPFKNEEDRKALLNKLLEGNFKESYGVELTEIEFNRRCKY